MVTDEMYKLSTYKEISVLAETASKKIYVVMDETTNKLYVKKVLPNTEHYSFYVRLASLKHKNLANIHDVICYDGNTYIFEEYTNGQTFQALLESEGFQTESKAADYAMQICDALIFLHSQNPPIIHRDIKPENIMLSTDKVIKLIDFDIAREFKQSAKRDTTFMGTKEYAAPEQYGFKQTDSRTDIYAIGVLLHEMLTGELPQNNITYKGALRKIIVKCLRLEPKQRYQSVSALKKALAATQISRYKKMGIYALSAIMAIMAIVMFSPNFTSGFHSLNNTSSLSSPAGTESKSDDSYDPYNSPPSSSPPGTEQNTDNPGLNDASSLSVVQTMLAQNYDALYAAFEKIESYEAKPTIILEQTAVNDIIRSITGNYYDSVAGAFQEYGDYIVYVPGHFMLPAYNVDDDGNPHDKLHFEISGEDMSITYYDADLEATFHFTSNDDKGLLSRGAFGFASQTISRENPVVFSESPLADITGVYYYGHERKIEIFEEAGEMKFSYTDIRRDEEAEPLLVETIHKLDDNHYWLSNYSFFSLRNKGRLMFNFSEKHLILLDDLEESENKEYGIAEVKLEGTYDKA